MKKNQFKSFVSVFFIFVCCAVYPEDKQAVVIAHTERSKKISWELTSESGFIVDIPNTDQLHQNISDISINITVKHNKLFLNEKKLGADRIMIAAKSGDLVFQNVHYDGSLEIVREKKRIVIKHVHNKAKMSDSTVTQHDKHAHIKLSQRKSKDFIVRVLLDEVDGVKHHIWKFSSPQGFMVMNPLEPSKKQKIESQELVIKTYGSGEIEINGTPMYSLQAYITPLGDTITFNDKHYKGSFWLLAEGQSNKAINCIGIEDYVATVLSTESWPGWSLDVNKVLAIACRTYVIAMVQNAKTMKRSYHVKNTNKHQTYGGGTIADIHRQAVDQTKGLFLTHQGQPITAMFDGCCGGVITKHMHGVDFQKAPYLARSYPCTYCKDFKLFSWQAEYDIEELQDILKKEMPKLRRLKDVKVTKKDKAGVVQKVSFKGNYWNDLHGKKIYSLLNKKVKSFYYSIEKRGSIITFKGRGYGHHLGLCQWGAKEMVAQGFDYPSVLEFYYPGTQLMRLL